MFFVIERMRMHNVHKRLLYCHESIASSAIDVWLFESALFPLYALESSDITGFHSIYHSVVDEG